MKKSILMAAFIIGAAAANAQQLQTSSMYDMQGMLHNPSIAGVQQDADVKGIVGAAYRSQWSGIKGAPGTVTVFGSFDVPSFNMGIGGYLYNDKTGPTSRTGAVLSLAKHIHFNNDAIFSLGIETRLQQYSIDRDKLTQTLGNDPALGTSDNRFKFDAGFGISFTNKKLQLGVSVSQLVQSKLNFYSGNMARTEEGQLYRHYYFSGRYNWNVDGFTTITPNIMAIYLPNAPVEALGGVRVEHNKLLWWGVGYRLHQSWMLSAGFHVNKKLTVGYSYDIYKTPISDFDGGHSAHEIMLRYNLIR
jgi:type IX secretion system PorP/SprF family membrane protein